MDFFKFNVHFKPKTQERNFPTSTCFMNDIIRCSERFFAFSANLYDYKWILKTPAFQRFPRNALATTGCLIQKRTAFLTEMHHFWTVKENLMIFEHPVKTKTFCPNDAFPFFSDLRPVLCPSQALRGKTLTTLTSLALSMMTFWKSECWHYVLSLIDPSSSPKLSGVKMCRDRDMNP